MSWVRRVLSEFGIARQLPTSEELDRTHRKHRRTLEKADRVIEDYRRLDGALRIYVERKK